MSDKPKPTVLGTLLRASRREKRMTLASVAAKTSFSLEAIQQIETGHHFNLNAVLAFELSLALDLPLREICAAAKHTYDSRQFDKWPGLSHN